MESPITTRLNPEFDAPVASADEADAFGGPESPAPELEQPPAATANATTLIKLDSARRFVMVTYHEEGRP